MQSLLRYESKANRHNRVGVIKISVTNRINKRFVTLFLISWH